MSYAKENSSLFTLEDERVVVLGAGRSGIAAANLAAARGATVRLFDSRENVSPEGVDPRVEVVTDATEALGEKTFSDYLVISPGIDTYGSLVKAFSKNTVEVMGELELGFRYYAGTCIGITGTNGKTTTTELIAHLINELGHSAMPCGNHGIPLSELVLNDPSEYAVVEASSFQLETISTFRSAVSLWLNLAPDHLDRYPNLESYKAAKKRIFENLGPEDWKVTRYEEGFQFPNNHMTFSSRSPDADFTIKGDQIMTPSGIVVDLSSTKLRGLHNMENAMAAIATIQCLGIDFTAPAEALLANYSPPAHRCEFIREMRGVEFINDSKSTNLHSLETALEAFTQPLILIIGGKEKGLDYTPLKGKLAINTKLCLTIGEIGPNLATLFSNEVETKYCQTLEDAVAIAQKSAIKGDYVLFSPGTSSFDMYISYIARGEAYREAVLALN